MNNNKDSNTSNKIEPKFNEIQAYEELRLIFVIAIETQNFDRVPAQIAAWEKKYPLAEFTDPEIIRKIKALLNRDYLNDLIGRYLADQILHIKEKQSLAYNKLQTIIASARKTKDYVTAQKEVKNWKSTLRSEGLSLYDFSPMYKSKICALLLVPSKELKNQDSALRDLKQLKERGSSLDSKTYSKEIDDWQNKYCIKKFPDKLQKELNSITSEVLQSIAVKTNEESALEELVAYITDSKKNSTPIDDMALILSKYDYSRFSKQAQDQISKLTFQALSIQDSYLKSDEDINKPLYQTSITSVQLSAINDLKDIVAKSSYNSDALLNWIYNNRKIAFSQFAREQIISQFTSAGYKIPPQVSYYIPEIVIDPLATNNSQLEAIRKNVILNYLGILSKGNSLSKSGKENISAIHTTSTITESLKNSEIILPVFDNASEVNPENEINDNEPEIINKDTDEEDICNIIIEDIISDPLTTYSLSCIPVKTETTELITEPLKNPDNSLIASDTIDLNKPTSTLSQEIETYTLTIEDQNNLEKAHELSTYIVVTAPILQMVQANKESQNFKEKDDNDDLYQKNNGF